jgi:hypothetical protein
MKRIIAPVVLLCIMTSINAQIDSLSTNYITSQTSKSDVITKYRTLLIDNIVDGNKEKVRELYIFANRQLDNSNYIALYPIEKTLICFWLNDFTTVSSSFSYLDSTSIKKDEEKIKPKDDQLYDFLLSNTSKNKELIKDQILSSTSLSDYDKDFLILLLQQYSTYEDKNYQELLNKAATDYINLYPNSPFRNYVRKNIRNEYETKPLGWGVEISGGSSILNQDISNYFDPGANIGLGFMLAFHNLHLNTRASILFSQLNHNIVGANYVWESGKRSSIVLPEINLSYKINLSQKLNVSPIIGVVWFSTSPSASDIREDSKLENVSLHSQASSVAGIDIGWNFQDAILLNPNMRKLQHNFCSLNLRYTVQSLQFPDKWNNMNGIAHNISLCVRFEFCGVKRKQ